MYVATLLRLTFWYRLVTGNGNGGDVNGLHEIDASGGSENDIESYALKGAITNALGHAASNLGWQQSVYLGLRSHKTVGGRKPAAKSAKPAPAPTASKPAPASKPTAPAAQTTASPTPAPAAPAQTTASLTPADDLTRFVIKIGKRAGKTLGDVYAEGLEGSKALEFYTTMAAGSKEKEALKNAAISFLARHNGHVPASTAA